MGKMRKYGKLRLFICGILVTYRFFSICGNMGKCCGIVVFSQKSELWELLKEIERNRNYGNISIFKNSELWEVILKIGIVGTYLRIGIVALIFRNYETLP
jgi:hypothetical protein